MLQYAGGIEVHCDPALILSYSGKLGVQPDRTLDAAILADAMPQLAIESSRQPGAGWSNHPAGLPAMQFSPPHPVSMAALTREQRLLGLFKTWTIIKHFSPHLQFATVNWETVLPNEISHIEGARSLKDYYKVLGQLTAKLNDGHVRIEHTITVTPREYFGIFFRHLYGRYIVTGSVADGARAGDELVAVDGRSVKEVEQDWRSYKSASTEQQMSLYLQQAASSRQWFDVRAEREFTLKGADGQRTIRARALRDATLPPPQPEATHERLSDDIGLIRLFRLNSLAAFNDALRSLRDTKGLILDLRSNATFPVNSIIGRFFDRRTLAQRELVPLVSGFDATTRSWKEFDVPIEPTGDTYRKPLVLMISGA